MVPDEITFHWNTKKHPFPRNLGRFPFLPGASTPSSFASRRRVQTGRPSGCSSGSPWARTAAFSIQAHRGMDPSRLSFPSAKRTLIMALQRNRYLPEPEFCTYKTQPPSLYHRSKPNTIQNKYFGLRNPHNVCFML